MEIVMEDKIYEFLCPYISLVVYFIVIALSQII